jgi:hypothetical protein
MGLPSPDPPKQPEASPAGTIAARIWDAAKKLATITEHLRTLEKEDARLQSQVLELSRTVLALYKDTHDLLGQMKGIEKRLEDRDKLVEATIKMRIAEEVEKMRAFTTNALASPTKRRNSRAMTKAPESQIRMP